MPRRWSATGLSVYSLLACANFSAISVSAVPKITRALRSRSACASLLIASAKSSGMAISLIPTVWQVMPHGLVLLSKTCCKSSAILSRSCSRVASSCLPIVSLSPVWAMCSIAFWYSCTSKAAFSTSQTVQYTTASTLTGTVSLVNVCSALNALTLTRWSMYADIWSIIGTMKNGPGPFSPLNLPMRSTTARSHWSATRIDADSKPNTKIPDSATIELITIRLCRANRMRAGITNTEMEMGLAHPLFFTFTFIVIRF